MPDDLTPEAFEALLHVLHPDRDQAGELYVKLCHELVRIFERRSCDSPEDRVDETLVRVGNNLLKGLEIRDLGAYSRGVAVRVAKESIRKEGSWHRFQKRYSSFIAAWAEEDEAVADQRLEALRACLAKLTPEQQDLIVSYHQDADRIRLRKELARRLGLDMNALRIRVHRLRRSLETCVEETLRG